ncbi:uncharacterized protein LOC105445327 [Strongylocentrotus purpuratus]|uniref:Uncharacterized protein n=1 Tax=Strongylocentrotus purpuratus TaxID=7668 RepID=A0A7M7PQ37_STRPU|nr:uncharacterized protein LOC105445327 [Strongylocentrotus purpuratus]
MSGMLPSHHWTTVLIVLAALITYACGSCSWHIDVVRSEFPYLFEPIVQNKLNYIVVNLEDVTVGSLPEEVEPCMYPYFVQVQVECDEISSSSTIEALLSAGSYPRITISFGALQDQSLSYHTWTDYVFEGALLDMEPDCNVGFCRPVWLVPLPTNEKYLIIHVSVETVGVVKAVSMSRRMITLDGYSQRVSANSSYVHSRIGADTDLSGLGLFENETHQVLPVHTVRGITPIQAMAGFVRRPVALISSDFFQHYRAVEIDLGDSAPHCLSGPPIKEAATFPDKIILSTAWGLFEMFADNYATTDEVEVGVYRRIELDQCIHHLVVPSHGRQGPRFLSVGQDGKKLYMSNLEFGVPTQLEELVDFSGNSACDHIGQSSCTIIDAAFGNVDMEATYVLVKTAGQQIVTHYHLLKLNGHGQWDMITSLEANLTIPHAVSGIDRDLINVSGLGRCDTRLKEDATCMTLGLTGLTFSGYVSKHLFFWGNSILHSPDNGKTVFVLLEYTSQAAISLFVVGKDPSFALLNTHQEIWYGEIGDNVYLKKLRPSPGWGRMLRLTGQQLEDPSLDSVTVSIYFDSWGTLYEFIAYGSSNQTKLRRRRIDQGEILANSVYSFAMEELQHEHEGGDHGGEEMIYLPSVSPLLDYECPYSQVNFENLRSIPFERRERYFLSAPQLAESDKHTEKSLMIYQVIVHHLLSEKEDLQTIKDNEIAEVTHNPFRKWYGEMDTLRYFYQYLFQNKNLQSGIHIDPDAYYLQPFGNTPEDTKTLPSTIYLDKHEVFEFAISLELGLTHSSVEIEDLYALVEVSNDDVLGINTHYFEYRLNNTIRYEVTLSDKGALELQASPGVDLYPASVLIHVWHSTFSCFIKEGDIFKPESLVVTGHGNQNENKKWKTRFCNLCSLNNLD